MINLKSTLTTITVAALSLLLPPLVSSCSMMHDDFDGCKQELRVRFKYDMNMKFADAFSGQVRAVTLHVYDQSGRLVFKKTQSVDDIDAAGGYMTLDNIKSGNYTMQVWAEGEQRHTDSYSYSTKGDTNDNISNLDCKINRNSRQITHDITPLYHGLLSNADLNIDGYGVKTVTVPLTKDTNNIRVVVQNASGKKLSSSNFAFVIDDDNSWLDFDNLSLKEDSITYNPWAQSDGIVNSEGSMTQVSAVVAEMTVNRLFTTKHPRLKVYNTSNNKLVFNIPLIDYALLVKGNYNKAMTDQEYLDRQDEYNFIFFVDENLNWLSATIYVNSWRVVLQNTDM